MTLASSSSFLVSSVICVPASSPPHPTNPTYSYQPWLSLNYTVSPMKAKVSSNSLLERRGKLAYFNGDSLP